ncbi:MAG TPA: ATPase domain-containing protein [Byssovorax sp.]|jgi:circadian clock protein KaiC
MAACEKTGIEGLDDVLCGGLPTGRMYVLEGDPGAGKTTVAMQFLLEGVRAGDRALYITLSETSEEIAAIAASHGWSLEGLDVLALSAADPAQDEANTLFHPSEVELGERIGEIVATIDRVAPKRVVLDSCSELRLLAQSPLRFRRQILSLKRHLTERGCTVVLIDNPTSVEGDVLLQSLGHGVIRLEQLAPAFGAERRRLRVTKLRGVAFRGGLHDFTIQRGGLVVYPRLVAAEHLEGGSRIEALSSGLPGLDRLLGGGLERGTATLLMGPAGTGKSALATQYAVAAAARGERALIYLFEEEADILKRRSASLGLSLDGPIARGDIVLHQVDPAELAPGQFAHAIRADVESRNARIVVIDSLNGYLHAMPDERFLTLHLHELLTYLRHRGVLAILVEAQHGLIGGMQSPVDVSYLADTVVLLRYFEAVGEVRKAMSILKKRSGRHESTIREFKLGPNGIQVGEPLVEFHGVLTGVPQFSGGRGVLQGEP